MDNILGPEIPQEDLVASAAMENRERFPFRVPLKCHTLAARKGRK